MEIETLLVHGDFIFALYGNYHIATQLGWRDRPNTTDQSLTWLLKKAGISTYSIAQNWHPDCKNEVLSATSEVGVAASSRIMRSIKVYEPTIDKPIADLLVCWHER